MILNGPLRPSITMQSLALTPLPYKPEGLNKNADQTAACNTEDDEAEIPANEHIPQLPSTETTLIHTTHKEVLESTDPSTAPDHTWLMQSVDDDQAWRSFLQHVRSKLETVNKVELAMITDGLLRRLDWHGTNRAAGYLLGHMGGRTQELTSLLVAFSDDTEIDSEIYEPSEVEGIWGEAQHFIPMHPGSDRRHGRRLSQEAPCIMMTMREVPSDFLTPGNTPSQRTPPATTPKQSRRKFLKVEINTGNQDGEGTNTVMLPLENNEACLHLRLTVKNNTSSEENDTVAAGSSPGITHPPAAPGLLGEAGLSLNDLMGLHEKWSQGALSMTDRRRHRRRRDPRSGERDRSRNARPAAGSNRALRIQERVTRETRHLGRECATSSWEPRRPVPEDTAGQAPARTADTGEMDILEATGRWFVMLGLRRSGQENLEPSNAMTKSMQAEARSTLRSMSEADLNVMVTALLRLTGMLYIESARLLTQARDDRRRTTEEVEIEVEADDDDESIYMQKFAAVQPKAQWGDLLQELLRLAETGGEANKGLLTGLQRRIRDSLYLQTEKGAQLQATLVVAVHSAEEGATEVCDTEDNDARLLEEWWGKLKRLMDFGADDSQARGSGDQAGTIAERKPLASTEHLDREVQQWEEERQDLEAEPEEEQRARQAELRHREEEEKAQELRDEVLFEQHRAGLLRDWEQWVVLHSTEPPKRRRLMVTAEHADGRAEPPPVRTVVLPQGADRIDTMKVTFQVAVEPDMPGPDQRRESAPTPMDPTGELYERAYRSWRNGQLQDEGVVQIFGSEWLFLFQINRDGLEGDTMAGQHGATQLDSEWGRPLLEQPGVTSA